MNEETKDLHFPRAGLDVSQAFSRQPNRPAAKGDYARTTAAAVNVRAFESFTGRIRGGSRPGLARFLPTAPVSGWIIQELAMVISTSASAQS